MLEVIHCRQNSKRERFERQKVAALGRQEEGQMEQQEAQILGRLCSVLALRRFQQPVSEEKFKQTSNKQTKKEIPSQSL
jgi:hypothetical protein